MSTHCDSHYRGPPPKKNTHLMLLFQNNPSKPVAERKVNPFWVLMKQKIMGFYF